MKGRIAIIFVSLLLVALMMGGASGSVVVQEEAGQEGISGGMQYAISTPGEAGPTAQTQTGYTQEQVQDLPLQEQAKAEQEGREADAARKAAQGLETGTAATLMDAPGPGDTPDYFGPWPNYALSPLPEMVTRTITEPWPTFYFAEGTCRPNFDPYITIQNAGDDDANVRITYMMGDSTTNIQDLIVPGSSRGTVHPPSILGVADDAAHDFSAKVECTNGKQILAERPMYFSYKLGEKDWMGGTDVIGATAPHEVWYFAEGTCRPNFDPYITIQNPGITDASVTITYMTGEGTTATQDLMVPSNSRGTVRPSDVLGVSDDVAHDFSAKVECTNGQQIVAERPMYFNYKPGEKDWMGGTCVVGANTVSDAFYFAEGTCRPSFDPYITIQNPGLQNAEVTINYMRGDGNSATEYLDVGPNSRLTVFPRNALGTGEDVAHDFSTKVECTNGQKILVERPMYFNYKEDVWGCTGGHVVIGATELKSTFHFAEGSCRPNFDPYITIQNAGSENADIKITYMKGDSTTDTQEVIVPAGSRGTVHPVDVLGAADDSAHDFSTKVECTNGQLILAERPMYFDYTAKGMNWKGGTDAVGYWFSPHTREVTEAKEGTGIRKFVDGLPGLGAENANNLGSYIPVAIPDTTTYPGCDYYEIELGRYEERLHSDLPPTLLAGYRQTNTSDETVNKFHYMAPLIVSQRDRPVRITFTNNLPTGEGGDLFVPCDTTILGAGPGPLPGESYTQNRAVIHLHGGNSPWISDGTPHQWIVPAGEATNYKEGVSTRNVPDMWFLGGNVIPDTVGQTTPPVPGATNDPGEGSVTYYYTNQQSSRLLFYHDHALAITRLNVYIGMAAPYLIQDAAEQALIDNGIIPSEQIPLVIQDKTFVPDDMQLQAQDPTWDKAKWGGLGSLWLPHVYMPNQNPASPDGFNAMARWHYGPWFWPPTTALVKGPQPNPYYDPVNAPWEPPEIPGTPTPSMVMESFLDTPTVNGTAYPVLEVEPKSYRFRILSVANDRGFNLQLYEAKSQAEMWKDGKLNDANAGEVKMVPAQQTPGFPDYWPVDGREGGVPDPNTAGPSMIQIGNDGGFLPQPVVLENRPIQWVLDPTLFRVGLVDSGTLMLGPAERADVIVDFSKYAGKTLIMYNDAPAPWPAPDPRYDYYTGAPDLSDTGGAPGVQPGYGPNTRTIMQIKVADLEIQPEFDLEALMAAFASTPTQEGAFVESQDDIIVPNAVYDSAYDRNFPEDTYTRIYESEKTFTTLNDDELTIQMQPKAIQDEMGEAFDKDYGRMSGFLGLEVPLTGAGNQNFILYPYLGPPVDVLGNSTPQGAAPVAGDETQIWKITHNGVDTHTLHFHKYDVQLINRVGWDNQIVPPDPNELGWKETVRVNPLEDTIVAMRPVHPVLPFEVPNSIRLLDPTKPEDAILPPPPPTLDNWIDTNGDPTSGPAGPGVITNEYVNFGSEFVLHCHLLSHEEMDMMHTQIFSLPPIAPTDLVATPGIYPSVDLTWTDNTIQETAYVIEYSDNSGPWTVLVDNLPPDTEAYTDTSGWVGTRVYRVFARNTTGLTTVPNFPTMNVDSTPAVSNPVDSP
jgi:FtsP/CotA-like multicopper oxidase with cupredoxin domain